VVSCYKCELFGKAGRQRATGISQNILFNLYLIGTKIEYIKKNNSFYSDPLPDLRPETRLGSVWIFCFCIYVWLSKIQITRVMVSCSLVGARVGLLYGGRL
jgi:hypothetical protein